MLRREASGVLVICGLKHSLQFCRTARWYSRSRCRSYWGSQATCQTSSASSEHQLCGVEWPGEVVTDVDSQVLDVQWPMRPHVHYHLLHLVHVAGEFVGDDCVEGGAVVHKEHLDIGVFIFPVGEGIVEHSSDSAWCRPVGPAGVLQDVLHAALNVGQHHSLKTLDDDWSQCYWSIIIQAGRWALLGGGGRWLWSWSRRERLKIEARTSASLSSSRTWVASQSML